MRYLRKKNRLQVAFVCIDNFVKPDSIVRIIDAFVDSLDMKALGIKEGIDEGRPGYPPQEMLKLYIYGNHRGTRSSRALAEECRINVECMWLMSGLQPDFRTIADFRKNNIKAMKKVFHEFNRRMSGNVEWGFTSVDGSKFQANNAKESNFTKNKLDDRIQWLDEKVSSYLTQLDALDEAEDVGPEIAPCDSNVADATNSIEDTVNEEGHLGDVGAEINKVQDSKTANRIEIQAKKEEAEERLKKYKEYQRAMEETGSSQLSITDVDARLMKSKDGFQVSYNMQTAVDSASHLILDFRTTNQVTDHGLIAFTMEDIRVARAGEILEIVADKGYEESADMVNCLEQGIIPHVIPGDGKDEYELELSYEECEEVDVASTDPEEIKRCLRSGIVPDVYKDVIKKAEIKEVKRKIVDESQDPAELKAPYKTEEEMMGRASEGFFVRDPERELIYCPVGAKLRPKCTKKNGNVRYANKQACKNCKFRNQCCTGQDHWKEIDFNKDTLEKRCKTWPASKECEDTESPPTESQTLKAKSKGLRYHKVKIVKLWFQPDKSKMAQRLCVSEHPFATIKRSMGSSWLALRGMEKVEGEFALFALGYNIKRAINLLGFKKLMELMARA